MSFVENDSGNNQTLLMHVNELNPRFPHLLISLGAIQYIRISSDSWEIWITSPLYNPDD